MVVASGDCLTALGTVAGLQAAGADPAVVWFDAHGDVQTPETTSSGYLAGMSLRSASPAAGFPAAEPPASSLRTWRSR